MVRASVLDAALQLGFGGPNSTVANWIFNNPLDEEEEPEEVSTSFAVLKLADSDDLTCSGSSHKFPS
jgi:hypothetical protein